MESFSDSKTSGYIAILIATVAVSTSAILISLCESDAILIAFWRNFFATFFLMFFLANRTVREDLFSTKTKNNVGFLIISGFFLALHFYFWILSLNYTSVASSVIIVNSSPIWVIFLSFLLFNQRISNLQILGVIVGFFGLGIIGMSTNAEYASDAVLGNVLALLGALMVAVYFIIGKNLRNAGMSNIVYIFIVNLSCAIFLCLIALLLGKNIFLFPSKDLPLYIGLAIGPSLLGHALYNYCLKFFSAQSVSLAVIAESVCASILGWLILFQELPEETILGGILVFIGIYINVTNDKSSKKLIDINTETV